MNRPCRHRTAVRHLLVALCAAGLVLPTLLSIGVASAQETSDKAQTQDRLGEVEDEIQGARQELHDINRDHGLTQADLRIIDARRAQLRVELERLNDELRAAQVRLDRREAALAQTRNRLKATERELSETRAQLDDNTDQFARRARASYMHGVAGYSEVALDVRGIGELADTMTYVHAVMESDREQVEVVDGLRRRVRAAIEQLELLRDRQAAERAEAAAERNRVAGIVEQRKAVQAQADAEAARHRAVLAQLDADRDQYQQRVTSLEQESANLEAALRQIVTEEEQRRREEAERQARAAARREAEERRRAAEAAARSSRDSEPEPEPEPAPAAVSSSGFVYPVPGGVTSGFGYRTHPITGTSRLHTGWDMSAGYGQPIVAAASGTVFSSGWLGGYGNAVVILHSGGISTLYAHQSNLAVSSGQAVGQGEVIGYVGSTGFSTGPHLHFEVRVNGTPVDPSGYL